MMRRCIWQLPDDSIQLTTFATESVAKQDETIRLLFSRGHLPEGTLMVADGDEIVINALLPADRTKRDKWRWRGGRVREDDSVPDKPHPRQALLDEIQGASNLGDLKAAMKKFVEGR